MKILLIGKNGQVGWELQRTLAPLGEVVAVDYPEIDLSDELYGPVFEPLRDREYFVRFQVDPEAHTLTWPNGADFAPEFLHHKVAVAA